MMKTINKVDVEKVKRELFGQSSEEYRAWDKAGNVLTEIHQILSKTTYGLNSPMARLEIIKLLVKSYPENG